MSTIYTGLTDIQKTAQQAATELKSSKVMGKEDFLRMLVAQLKNQDPLKPMDGTDFAAQLCQFSSLEQLTNIRQGLESLGESQNAVARTQALGLIGKEIMATQGDTFVLEGNTADLRYSLSGDAARVDIRVFDEQGKLVDTLSVTDRAAGDHRETWYAYGNAPGQYRFDVHASDEAGKEITSETMIAGIVEEVHFRKGEIYLTVNGQEVALGDVTAVIGGESEQNEIMDA